MNFEQELFTTSPLKFESKLALTFKVKPKIKIISPLLVKILFVDFKVVWQKVMNIAPTFHRPKDKIRL